MARSFKIRCAIICLFVNFSVAKVLAQKDACHDVKILSRMLRLQSVSLLDSERRAIADSFRAKLVFAIRQFELMPRNTRAADELLKLIPTRDDQELALKSFDGVLCKGESETDLRSMSEVGDHFDRDLAKAVLVSPRWMDEYVAYAAEAVQDPDSDYAVQMEKVCRQKHRRFEKAVENLGDGAPELGYFAKASADWFRNHILDPSNCRALKLPEAE